MVIESQARRYAHDYLPYFLNSSFLPVPHLALTRPRLMPMGNQIATNRTLNRNTRTDPPGSGFSRMSVSPPQTTHDKGHTASPRIAIEISDPSGMEPGLPEQKAGTTQRRRALSELTNITNLIRKWINKSRYLIRNEEKNQHDVILVADSDVNNQSMSNQEIESRFYDTHLRFNLQYECHN